MTQLGISKERDFQLHRYGNLIYVLDFIDSTSNYLPVKIEQTECSETSAYKIQAPGNYPKESIQRSYMSPPSFLENMTIDNSFVTCSSKHFVVH
jgi:hypothetical protein